MSNELSTIQSMGQAGVIANHYASQQVFNDYQLRKAANTLRAQGADLAAFAKYLGAAGVTGCPTGNELQNYPEAWQGVTWGLVKGFIAWLLADGAALTSVNRKLSTVKTYAALAAQAGTLAPGELTLIQTVDGYAKKEFNKVDEKRTKTRSGAKKQTNTQLTPTQAKALKQQPSSPQGQRDAVIMTLLLDHGLRVGELADLSINTVNLAGKKITFFRDKVQTEQTHTLSADALAALKAYIESGNAPPMGALLRQSNKSGELGAGGMTERSIWLRVRELGKRIDLDNLGPHDCRHYWATRAVKGKTDPFKLMQAGGWTSMQTVQKYVDQSAIANDGVTLSEEE